jgi:hypothetical protein
MIGVKIVLKREIVLYLGNTVTVHTPLTLCCQLSGQVEKC